MMNVQTIPVPLYSTEELKKRPVRSQGQTGDLRHTEEVRGVPLRYWTERIDTLDGAPYDETVAVEALIDGDWTLVFEYDGAGLRDGIVRDESALDELRG